MPENETGTLAGLIMAHRGIQNAKDPDSEPQLAAIGADMIR